MTGTLQLDQASFVDREDPRYGDLVGRGINQRFQPDPDSIRVISTTEHAVRSVQEAVESEKRMAVRSGGHCFEGFVDDPAIQEVLDMSELAGIGFDPQHQALSVGSGATLGKMYRTLYLGWGVTVPAGRCPDIGVGGHVLGGGGGALSRRFGLSVDHLYGVEVVVVDGGGKSRAVVATRNQHDPNRELWWAHTGGGGGFGVVTRYLFRSSDGELPTPPGAVLKKTAYWRWSALTEQAFSALVRNFTEWHERHSGIGDTGSQLDNSLTLPRVNGGDITLETAVDAARPDAEELTDAFLRAIGEGVGQPLREVQTNRRSWLASSLVPDEFAGVKGRFKSKAAFLRKAWTDDQIAEAYQQLSDDTTYQNPAAALYLHSHGGMINEVGSGYTAMAHRDAVIKAYWSVFWWDPREDDWHLGWIRDFYSNMFGDAGGVPDPSRGYGGAFINYADIDLADPELTPSGVPWHYLYYRDNYPMLQHVKERWDPNDVFGNLLSARSPEA